MAGIALANLVLAFMLHGMKVYRVCFVGLLLSIAGAIFSLKFGADSLALAGARFLAGIGEGCLLSRGYSFVGMT